MLVAAVGNYLIFFRVELVQQMRRGRRHMERQVQRSAEAGPAGGAMHKCVVCGGDGEVASGLRVSVLLRVRGEVLLPDTSARASASAVSDSYDVMWSEGRLP